MKTPTPSLLVHATNVNGLGAIQVVTSLLPPLCQRLSCGAQIFVPDTGPLSVFNSGNSEVTIARFRRALPNNVSRFLECLAPSLHFPNTERTLVLGDIPLAKRPGQVVLVHQPHLAKPAVNPLVSDSPIFRISRWLFERNLKFVSKIVVQTPVMGEELERSYPAAVGRIEVVSMPPPHWLQRGEKREVSRQQPLSLFYPAAGYPHKDHRILREMNNGLRRTEILQDVVVTLKPQESENLRGIEWITNVGRLSSDACLQHYRITDGVFFPSLLESCPLPLVEAMMLGLPIVCADLPYARWICEDEAIYFDSASARDAWRAIEELKDRLAAGWSPDWSRALLKLPSDWDEVAASFLEILAKA